MPQRSYKTRVEKEKEIKELKSELERTDEQITIDKTDLDYAISNKDEMIIRLEHDLEEKVNEINELNFKIDELINQVDTINIPVPIPDEEGSSLIIKTMKRMMEFKGFISDKEFELLLEKLSKKTIEVNL